MLNNNRSTIECQEILSKLVTQNIHITSIPSPIIVRFTTYTGIMYKNLLDAWETHIVHRTVASFVGRVYTTIISKAMVYLEMAGNWRSPPPGLFIWLVLKTLICSNSCRDLGRPRCLRGRCSRHNLGFGNSRKQLGAWVRRNPKGWGAPIPSG
jgi:hypothetical protein